MKIINILAATALIIGSAFTLRVTSSPIPAKTFDEATVMTMHQYESTDEFKLNCDELEFKKRADRISAELEKRTKRAELEAEIIANLISNLEDAGFELTPTSNGYIVEMGG